MVNLNGVLWIASAVNSKKRNRGDCFIEGKKVLIELAHTEQNNVVDKKIIHDMDLR